MAARSRVLTIVRAQGPGPVAPPLEALAPHFRPADHPKAQQLRQRFGLARIAGAGSDFARARRLKTWVRTRWNHGYDHVGVDPAYYSDALNLLSDAATGKCFSCGFYAQTLVQCALALGLPARTLSIHRQQADFPWNCRGNSGHSVAEIYCRELAQWVLIDADLNGLFVDARDKPLSALELHHAWHEKRGQGVRLLTDAPAFVPPPACPGFTSAQLLKIFGDFTRHQSIDYYWSISTSLVHGYSADEKVAAPDRLLGYAALAHPSLARHFRGLRIDHEQLVTRPEQFNWPIDQCYLQARMAGDTPTHRVELLLRNSMPFFSHYQLKVGAAKARKIAGDKITLTLQAPRTRVIAQCIDSHGRPGHGAELTLTMTRRPFAGPYVA